MNINENSLTCMHKTVICLYTINCKKGPASDVNCLPDELFFSILKRSEISCFCLKIVALVI